MALSAKSFRVRRRRAPRRPILSRFFRQATDAAISATVGKLSPYANRVAAFIRNVSPRHRKIVFSLFVVFCVATFLDFPQKADAVVVNDIAALGRQAAKSLAQNQGKVAEKYFGGNNPAFGYLCYCCQLFVVFPASMGFLRWLREDEDLKVFIELVVPFIVLASFANGGFIIGQLVLVLYKIFDGIINNFDSYTAFNDLIKQARAKTLVGHAIAPLLKQCEPLVGADQISCVSKMNAQSLSILRAFETDLPNTGWLSDMIARYVDLGKKILDPATNVDDKIRTVLWTATAPLWEGVLMIVLNAFFQAWQFFYGIAFILTGLAAPMAATASVFTSSVFLSGAYALWLTGMFTLFLARLLLYVAYGMTSELVTSIDSTDTIWFGVMTAFIIPFVVYSIVKGSASGVWSSLVGVSTSAIGTAASLVPGAGSAAGIAVGAGSSGGGASESAPAPASSSMRVETQY
jgi:hypothetical protein